MDPEQAERRDEELIDDAYKYISDKVYPEGCSESRRRVIRKKAARFEVKVAMYDVHTSTYAHPKFGTILLKQFLKN